MLFQPNPFYILAHLNDIYNFNCRFIHINDARKCNYRCIYTNYSYLFISISALI